MFDFHKIRTYICLKYLLTSSNLFYPLKKTKNSPFILFRSLFQLRYGADICQTLKPDIHKHNIECYACKYFDVYIMVIFSLVF